MGKKQSAGKSEPKTDTPTRKKELAAALSAPAAPPGKPSSLVDTRVIYCGDCLEQLEKLPPACVDLIYIDPPFNSNRNYEVFWGETARPEDRRRRVAMMAAAADVPSSATPHGSGTCPSTARISSCALNCQAFHIRPKSAPG